MRHLDDDAVTAALSWSDLFAALEPAFARKSAYRAPERLAIAAPHQPGSFLTMPCADPDGYFGVKCVTVLPDNAAAGRPTVQAHYTLFAPDGAPVLSCAATMLTRLRTAAVSALAARTLAPPEAKTLLVIGTGALAPWMAAAHAQVRPYARIVVWGRDPAKAAATADAIEQRLAAAPPAAGGSAPEVAFTPELEAAVRGADVITVATTARTPIVRGAWLTGQHLDLVGAFAPEMAEADPEAVRRALVVVDDRSAARAEAGDLIQAAAAGWSFEQIAGDLGELLAGRVELRRPTLFKSVGLALEDLAVARLLHQLG